MIEELREAIRHLQVAAKLTDRTVVADLIDSAATLAAASILLQQKLDLARLLTEGPKPTRDAGVQRRD